MTITADTATYPGAGNAANQTSYATGSFTPVAGDLVIVIVGSSLSSGVPVTPTITGNGQTWTLLGGGLASSPHKIAVFYTVMTSPTTGAITFDYAGTTQQRAAWSVIGFRSSLGPMSVTNYITDAGNSTASSATTVTATGGAGVWSGIYAGGAATAFTKDTNYTINDNVATGAETGRLATQYRINSVADLTPSWTWATSGAYGHAVVLLVEPVPTTTVTPSEVTEVFTVDTPTVAVDALVTPAAVAAVYAVDTPTPLVAGGATTVTPAAVAQVDLVPTPGLLAASTVVPATVLETFVVDTPTRLAASTVIPATVLEVDTVPTPTVLAAATVVPATVLEVDTVPTPTVGVVTGPVTVTPATVDSIYMHPESGPTDPTVRAASLVTPPVTAGVHAVDTPSATGGFAAVASPAAVAAVDTVPGPSSLAASLVAPAAVAALDTVPGPSPAGGAAATALPAAVAAVDTVPAPALFAGALITPNAVAQVDTVPTPVTIAGAGAVATPNAVAQVDTVPTPVPFSPGLVAPALVAQVDTVPGPTPLGVAQVTPGSVVVLHTADTPSIIAGAGAVATPLTVTVAQLVHTPTLRVAHTVFTDADLTVGAWTTNTGATTGLEAALADVSEANFIQSESNPAASAYAAALQPTVDPGVSTGHIVSWAHRNPESGDLDLTTQLRQGYVSEASQGTLIAEWTELAIPATFTTVTKTLTVGEANTITDYTDLSLRFSANAPGEPVFSPADLTGLVVWLDAADYTPGTWANRGSDTAPTIVGTPAPTISANTLNGLPLVRFTVSEGRIRAGWSHPVHDYTLIYLTRWVGPTAGRMFTAQYPPSNFLVGAHTSTPDSAYDNGTWIGAGVTWADWTPGPGPWRMYGGDSANTLGFRFYIDGVLKGSTGGTGGLTNGWALSGYDATTAAESMDFEVAELVIYNRRLDDAERIQVEDYLQAKWITSSAVPATVTPSEVAVTAAVATPAVAVAPTVTPSAVAAVAAVDTPTVVVETVFTPAALSGLTAWYDASTLALSDGADVTSWPDLSGGGHGLTPLTSGKPTYQTSELNGLGVVRYGGVTDEHLVTSVGGDYRHFFLVAKYDLTTFASYNGLLGGDADLVLVGSGGTDIWYSYLETEYRWNGVVGTMRPAPMGVWGQMGVTKTAGWLNLKVWIGSDRGFAGRQWDGDVAEVIGYDRILTDSERLQVEAYLADKWGL